MAARPRVVIANSTLRRAMDHPDVRRRMQNKAERVAAMAGRLAIADGAPEFARSIRIERGTRPGSKSPRGIKRPYVRVIATSADAVAREHGDRSVRKAAILRRASGA